MSLRVRFSALLVNPVRLDLVEVLTRHSTDNGSKSTLNMGMWKRLTCLRIGFCEHGNEPSGFIKCDICLTE